MSLSAYDMTMIRLAKARVPIVLDDGRTGRLVCWRPTNKRGSRGQVFRVEFPSGRRATVQIRHLAGITGHHGDDFPMPRPLAGDHEHDDPTHPLDPGGRQGSRGDLSPTGLLAADGGGASDRLRVPGQRAQPPLHERGSAGPDRDRRDLPVGLRDTDRDARRTPVGGRAPKGTP